MFFDLISLICLFSCSADRENSRFQELDQAITLFNEALGSVISEIKELKTSSPWADMRKKLKVAYREYKEIVAVEWIAEKQHSFSEHDRLRYRKSQQVILDELAKVRRRLNNFFKRQKCQTEDMKKFKSKFYVLASKVNKLWTPNISRKNKREPKENSLSSKLIYYGVSFLVIIWILGGFLFVNKLLKSKR